MPSSAPLAARVLFPLPLPAYSYLLPFERQPPAVGCRVVVPWQQGLRVGLLMGLEPVPAGRGLELRELVDVLDEAPFVPRERLALIEELARLHCAPAGLVLASLLPSGLTEALRHEVRALPGVALEGLGEARWQPAETVHPSQLELWRRQGLVLERVRLAEPTTRVLCALREADAGLVGKPRAQQRAALALLAELGPAPSAAEFARQHDLPEGALRALVKKGYAGYREVIAPPPPLPAYPPEPLEPRELGLDAAAPAMSLAGGSRSERLAAALPLLRGDLARGRSVLVLVPEGALLAETASQLASALPVRVLSGELSDLQRRRLWRELAEAAAPSVLVGSYLALLAPLAPLGRVVVLEAGSSSYKLPSGPRLFVPSVARLLAEREGVPILYADALPTPETFHLVPASARHALPGPALRLFVADLSQGRNWPLSAELIQVLKQVAERSRQAVLLSPRRGFSAALGCSSCGYLAECPNCDLPLRYHQRPTLLRCHQCGFQKPPPKLCPNCRGEAIGPLRGAGTEWLLRELEKHVAPLPLYHYDADRRDDLAPLLAGEPGVVVATTAILRHPPLPNVSLVAVTLLDTLLGASDFRAEEEALRLLLQLAELQPSRRPLVLVQTFQPEHPILQLLRAADGGRAQERFLQRVLERRRRYRYPPFAALAKVQVSAREASAAEREATWLAGAVRARLGEGEDVLGPSPAPVARLKGRYAYQLFVRAPTAERLPELLEPVRAYAGRAKVRVDVDPRDIGSYLD